jgi:hypothetical protein
VCRSEACGSVVLWASGIDLFLDQVSRDTSQRSGRQDASKILRFAADSQHGSTCQASLLYPMGA